MGHQTVTTGGEGVEVPVVFGITADALRHAGQLPLGDGELADLGQPQRL